MKMNKVLLGVIGSAFVLGSVAVVGLNSVKFSNASGYEVVEEASDEVVVSVDNVDEDSVNESNESIRYRISSQRTIHSGQNNLYGDRYLVYSVNGGEEKQEKMHQGSCQGEVYNFTCDVEVNKGDVIEYKVVFDFEDGDVAFPMVESNGTVTVEESNIQ